MGKIIVKPEDVQNVCDFILRNARKILWDDRGFFVKAAVAGAVIGIIFGGVSGAGIARFTIGGSVGVGIAALDAALAFPFFLLVAAGAAMAGKFIEEMIKSSANESLVCEDEEPDELVKEYHENRRLKFEKAYKKGEANGWAREYYESGKLRAEGVYKNGEPDGRFREYYEDGKLKTETVFKDGILLGSVKEYRENGELKRPEENDR